MKALTARQHQVYSYIVDFFKVYRRAPTIREMCEYFDITGTVGLVGILTRLEAHGLITRTPGKTRSIRLVGQTCPHCDGLGTVLEAHPVPAPPKQVVALFSAEDLIEEFGGEPE